MKAFTSAVLASQNLFLGPAGTWVRYVSPSDLYYFTMFTMNLSLNVKRYKECSIRYPNT